MLPGDSPISDESAFRGSPTLCTVQEFGVSDGGLRAAPRFYEDKAKRE